MQDYKYVLELYHHGTKGMKWGVRRYQNPDGSLTAAGRVRYGAGQVGRAIGSAASKTGQKVSSAIKKRREERRIEKLRKKPLGKLTDAELKERINRMAEEKRLVDLERSMSDFNNKHLSAGKKFLSKALNEAIVPATINAGKEVLERWLKKHGYDFAGLKDTQYGLSKLAKEADAVKIARDMSDNKKQIELNNDFFKKREEAAKKEAIKAKVDAEIEENIKKAEKEAAKSAKKAEKEAKKVWYGKVQGEGTSTRKTENPKKEKPADYYDPIETHFVDRDEPVSNVRNSSAYQVGSSFVERLLKTD